MRGLALLPLIMLMFACGDSTLVQPEDDLTIAAAARAGRTVLTWQEAFDQSWDAGESFATPSGVLHMWGIDNGFFVTGDLEGYSHVYGRCQINLNSGKGACTLTASYAITEYLSQSVDGGFECVGTSKLEDFPVFTQYGRQECKGTGDFEGLRVKAETYNPIPGGTTYATTAEIW